MLGTFNLFKPLQHCYLEAETYWDSSPYTSKPFRARLREADRFQRFQQLLSAQNLTLITAYNDFEPVY